MRLYQLIPWCSTAKAQRRRLAAARAWQQHEREGADAVQMLLDQAAGIPAQPKSAGRIYLSTARGQIAPLLTPGQQARGHGGRP